MQTFMSNVQVKWRTCGRQKIEFFCTNENYIKYNSYIYIYLWDSNKFPKNFSDNHAKMGKLYFVA